MSNTFIVLGFLAIFLVAGTIALWLIRAPRDDDSKMYIKRDDEG